MKSRHNVRHPQTLRKAFSLLEVMVGMVVFTIGAIGILALAVMTRRMAEEGVHAATALNTAQSIMEQISALPVTQPTGRAADPNYLDNPANTLSVVIVPPNAGLTQVSLPINRPPLSNTPSVWNWTQVVVPAVASAPALGGTTPPPPKNITVLVAVSISPAPTPPATGNTRQVTVFYTYVKPSPMAAIGTVKSLRLLTL